MQNMSHYFLLLQLSCKLRMPDDVAHIWELLNPDTKEAENIHFTSLAQPSLHLFDANSKAYRRSKSFRGLMKNSLQDVMGGVNGV